MGEGETPQFVARYASQVVTGTTFAEVGDTLAERGFDMARATATAQGVLLVPHTDRSRQAAHLYQELVPVEQAPKPVIPVQLDVATAMLAGAEVESGFRDGAALACRDCGAVHPEGVVCVIPIMYEMQCCTERTYPHHGPHEHRVNGRVTHRWVEELVITDLAFNGYQPIDEEEMG